MCQEEAAAEAATIRNKFSLQTLLDRKVMAAPTEQIYRDAYIAQAQALRPSNMVEAEKIAISAKKAENALFVAFHDGTIKNGIDRTSYPTYYGRDGTRPTVLPPSECPSHDSYSAASARASDNAG